MVNPFPVNIWLASNWKRLGTDNLIELADWLRSKSASLKVEAERASENLAANPPKETRRRARAQKDINLQRRHSESLLSRAAVIEDEIAVRLAMRDIQGGAGYPIDRFVRRQMAQLGGRDASQGERERRLAFYDVDAAGHLRMRPETNNALSFRDFAEADAKGLLDAGRQVRLTTLQEGVLHNFSPLELGREIEFEDEEGTRFAVAGFAMLREGATVRWLMLGGPVEPMLAWDDDAVRLEGEPDVRRISMSGSLDLATGRWAMADAVGENRAGRRLRVDPSRPAWLGLGERLAKMLLKLPAYCALKVRVVRPGRIAAAEVAAIEPEETEDRAGRKESDAAAPDEETAETRARRRRQFRVVSSLLLTVTDQGESVRADRPRRWSEPEFQVDVEGHHRRIAPASIGVDHDGKPIIGQTWVGAHPRWRDKPRRPGTDTVAKAPVMPALDYAGEVAREDRETTVTFRI